MVSRYHIVKLLIGHVIGTWRFLSLLWMIYYFNTIHLRWVAAGQSLDDDASAMEY